MTIHKVDKDIFDFHHEVPYLPAKIIETWGKWDRPLEGVCEIRGKTFFFNTLVESIYRHYTNNTGNRLQRIYAIYPIPIERAKELQKQNEKAKDWYEAVGEEADPIGIFWR